VLDALFDGFNTYLGNYIGGFLGELSINAFFLLASWAMLRSRAVPRGFAILGLVTGTAGLVGMFRNVTSSVAVVASVNNYLLPLWMIVFGILLLRQREASTPVVGASLAHEAATRGPITRAHEGAVLRSDPARSVRE